MNRKFTVDNGPAPYVNLGTYTEDTNNANRPERTPGAGVRTYGGGNDWFLALPQAASGTERSNHEYVLDTASNSTIPFPSFAWSTIEYPRHRASLAATPASSRIYLFYVE